MRSRVLGLIVIVGCAVAVNVVAQPPVAAPLLPAVTVFAQAPPPAINPLPAAPVKGVNAKTGAAFPRGAKPASRQKLATAPRHRVVRAAPTQFAVVPKQLSMWLNDTYGDCVTAQEAFAKAAWSIQCGLPELFVPDAEVKRWASAGGFLNGADLTEVMDAMIRDGFHVGGKVYGDGPYTAVDFSNEPVLQNAIFTGPVNIAIDANALPSGAGNRQGWFDTSGGNFPNTDHCVCLTGFGTADYLYSQLGVPVPAGLTSSTKGYLLFTWSTIGFVSHQWLMSTCEEAWVRNPTTPGQSPSPAVVPKINAISPANGPPTGGTQIAVVGSGFTGATTVSFGATPAAAFTITSDTSFVATSPAGSGTVDVTVTGPGGTSVASAGDQFAYGTVPPPSPPPPGPTPGTGFTGSLTYTYVGGVVTNITTGVAPASGLEAELKGAGVSPNIIADVLRLVTDIKAKAGFATLLADVIQIVTDLKTNEPAPPPERHSTGDPRLMPAIVPGPMRMVAGDVGR